jgi:hypothetical protein
MAEAMSPPLFSGLTSEDAQIWYNNLLDFIEYKTVPNEKKLSLFKLRLGDYARDWLTSLPDDQKDSFEHLSAAFLARFRPKEMEKFRYAKELFNDRQAADETVDQFITKLRKKAAVVGIDPAMQVFACINGLIPSISAYVLEHKHDSLEEILKHARVAEMTRSMSLTDTGSNTAQQLSVLTDQMCRLDAKLSKITTASIEKRDQSPINKRHVTFGGPKQRDRAKSPQYAESETRPIKQSYEASEGYGRQLRARPSESNNYRTLSQSQNAGPRPSRFENTQQRGNNYRSATRSPHGGTRKSFAPQQQLGQQLQQQQAACFRCGAMRAHANPLYCPMMNKNCFTCGKPGHSARVCRSTQNPTQWH